MLCEIFNITAYISNAIHAICHTQYDFVTIHKNNNAYKL